MNYARTDFVRAAAASLPSVLLGNILCLHKYLARLIQSRPAVKDDPMKAISTAAAAAALFLSTVGAQASAVPDVSNSYRTLSVRPAQVESASSVTFETAVPADKAARVKLDGPYFSCVPCWVKPPCSVIPEPDTALWLGAGLVACATMRRRVGAASRRENVR